MGNPHSTGARPGPGDQSPHRGQPATVRAQIFGGWPGWAWPNSDESDQGSPVWGRPGSGGVRTVHVGVEKCSEGYIRGMDQVNKYVRENGD